MRRSVFVDLDRLNVKDSHIQRFAGHVAGPSVLHRHYLIDDPKLRPGRQIAALIEQEVHTELPRGLIVPTRVRCTTGWQGHLAADAARIDVELAERGWLVVAQDAGEPLLTPAEVAQELEVTAKTARLWMADGRVPSIHWADRRHGAERRARLADVVAVRNYLRSQVTLREIADELDQPYHTVYQYLRAQDLPREPWGARDYVIPTSAIEHLRRHYRREAALHRRAVPLSVAASTLKVTVAGVLRLVEDDVLACDERAHDGRRMVTRDSLAAAATTRVRRTKSSAPIEDLIGWENARAQSGLADAELDALVADGTLVRVQHLRRRHLTRPSWLRYLVEHAPERLTVLSE